MFGSMTFTRMVLSGAIVALALLPADTFAQSPPIDRIVAFGTSLTDSGNAFIWLRQPGNETCGVGLNVPPYDAIEGFVPSGPYARGGHHITNGATWLEGLARQLSLAGNARPAFGGSSQASNYAVGGARAIAGVPCRVNLPDQVNAYMNDFASTSAETLIAIEIGSNDVQDALFAAASGQDPGQYIQQAIGSLTSSIVQLYAHGARRFLVLNVPDVGRTPAIRALDQMFPGTAASAGKLSQAYNFALALALQSLRATLPGIDLRLMDLRLTLDTVFESPEAYGFSNTTDACITPDEPPFACRQPDTYIFWDGVHPTKAVHAILADAAIEAISAQ